MRRVLCAVSLVAVTACSNSGADYVPIVDGPQNQQFQTDLAQCQDVARQRDYLNGDTATGATVGGVAGGALGGLSDGLGGAIAGAILGAGVGAGGEAYETMDERKKIVIRCMENRGHNIVG